MVLCPDDPMLTIDARTVSRPDDNMWMIYALTVPRHGDHMWIVLHHNSPLF
jgi:hypothetical protein